MEWNDGKNVDEYTEEDVNLFKKFLEKKWKRAQNLN